MTLYDEVLDVARDYLGAAAQKFVNIQIKKRLKMEPYQLTAQHLEELAKWCYASGQLVMRHERAEEFSKRVQALSG
jgi:hypothetical protein